MGHKVTSGDVVRNNAEALACATAVLAQLADMAKVLEDEEACAALTRLAFTMRGVLARGVGTDDSTTMVAANCRSVTGWVKDQEKECWAVTEAVAMLKRKP